MTEFYGLRERTAAALVTYRASSPVQFPQTPTVSPMPGPRVVILKPTVIPTPVTLVVIRTAGTDLFVIPTPERSEEGGICSPPSLNACSQRQQIPPGKKRPFGMT